MTSTSSAPDSAGLPEGAPRHETVVVGVDGSAASGAAVRYAAAEASRRRARLHAVHVVEPGQPEVTARERDLRLELELAREGIPGRVAGWVFTAGIEVDIAVSVVTGDVALQLARQAGEAVLVVIGAPDSLHHSALPVDLTSGCSCPVAIVGALGDVTVVQPEFRPSTEGASHART